MQERRLIVSSWTLDQTIRPLDESSIITCKCFFAAYASSVIWDSYPTSIDSGPWCTRWYAFTNSGQEANNSHTVREGFNLDFLNELQYNQFQSNYDSFDFNFDPDINLYNFDSSFALNCKYYFNSDLESLDQNFKFHFSILAHNINIISKNF